MQLPCAERLRLLRGLSGGSAALAQRADGARGMRQTFSIRLMMEDAAGLPNVDKYKALGKITIDDADGALCATLAFDLGGERA